MKKKLNFGAEEIMYISTEKFFDSVSAVFLLGQFLVHLVSCPVFYSVGHNASHSRISKSSAIVSTYPAISYSNN